MSKKQPMQEPVSQPGQETNTAVAVVEPVAIPDLFKRSVNTASAIKSITLKRTLTRPLISMGRLKMLACECSSEMYTIDIPMSGRGGGSAPARVVDVLDVQNGEECLLIVHETMASAIERAGYVVLKPVVKEGVTTGYTKSEGLPLKGHAFAFRTLALKGDKNYHTIETAEIEVTR